MFVPCHCQSVRIGGFKVDQPRNSIRVAVCNRTQFRPGDGVSYQNCSIQFERVNHRQRVITEAVSRVLRG